MNINTEPSYIELHTYNPEEDEYVIKIIPQQVSVYTNSEEEELNER